MYFPNAQGNLHLMTVSYCVKYSDIDVYVEFVHLTYSTFHIPHKDTRIWNNYKQVLEASQKCLKATFSVE
ncbi:unnamed protein product, partial [Trichobilharzia szidati]